MNTAFWIFLLVFYALWTVFTALMARDWFRARWVPEMAPFVTGERSAMACLGILAILPAGFGVWLLTTGPGVPAGMMRPGVITLWASAFVLGPQILFSAFLAVGAARAERNAAGDTDPLNRMRAQVLYVGGSTAFPVTLLLIHWLSILPSPRIPGGMFWIVYFAIWGGRAAYAKLNGTRLGGGFIMDDTPLRSEILTAAGRFGVSFVDLTVRPNRKYRALYRLPLLERSGDPLRSQVGRSGFGIPLPNLLHVEPNVITAALYYKWAKVTVPESFLAYVRGSSTFLAFCVVVVAAIIGTGTIGTLVIVLVKAFTSAGWLPFIILLLLGGGFIVAVGYYIGRVLGWFPTAFEAHANAYKVWAETDRWTVLRREDYFVALARYRAFVLAIRRPEIVLHQLCRDRALMRLLDDGLPGTRERALESARSALEEDEARRAGNAGSTQTFPPADEGVTLRSKGLAP